MANQSRGYFGIGVYRSKNSVNIGTLMRSAYCFGASFVFTVGKRYAWQSSDTTDTTKHVPYYDYQTFEELRDLLPVGCQLIGVEQTLGAAEVGDCHHPDRCVYLLGAEDCGLPPRIIERCHRVIEIPGVAQCLNVATAGSIVMFDRMRSQKFPAKLNGRRNRAKVIA